MADDQASTHTDDVYEEPVRDQASDAHSDPDGDPEMMSSGERGAQQDQAEGDDDSSQTGSDA